MKPLRIAFVLLLGASLAGCSIRPPVSLAPPPARLTTAAAAPALKVERIRVLNEPGGHHARIVGAPGSARGQGVWGSPGRHDSPAPGDEAAVAPDGAFDLELHAHPGEEVTVWAFVDDASGRRRYSSPLTLQVPHLPH